MSEFKLASENDFADLYTKAGLNKIDALFISHLENVDSSLSKKLLEARKTSLETTEVSKLILELSPYLEDFLACLFSIESDVQKLQKEHHELAPLFYVKRQFIQRRAVKKFNLTDAQSFDGNDLARQLESLIGNFNELTFSFHVQEWLADEARNAEQLELAARYAAWATLTKEGQLKHNSGILFKIPIKTNYENLLGIDKKDELLRCEADHKHLRDGFSLTDPGLSRIQAVDEATYCIHCHHQGKDSCSKGLQSKQPSQQRFQQNPLGQDLGGCPLEEKISEMQECKSQGYTIAALAIICIDNPLVAATGHRICNDCMKACIYQKQQPVNIPGVETQVLQDVLSLPWGFEIYSLLTRWNPLNINHPLPLDPTNKSVLVVGMGPAGFTLSHYLMQSGHTVIAIDGLKIEPLPDHFLKPIRNIKTIYENLDERITWGFGGVAEYGITVRWDKNNLLLIRLLLERRSLFSLFGGVRFGGTITASQAFNLGIDHIALCMGAGSPTLIPLKNGLANGVRQASDFLMALQLTGAGKRDSLSNLEINLPAIVIGGGLTAIDTATEIMAYYPRQVEKFYRRYQQLVKVYGEDFVHKQWTSIEWPRVKKFINHGQLISNERQLAAQEGRDPNFLRLVQNWGGVTLVYRQDFTKSPSYRNNHEEVKKALEEGINILDHAMPVEVLIDDTQHACGLKIRHFAQEKILTAQSILIAAGTKPNVGLYYDDPEHFTYIGNTLQALDAHYHVTTPERTTKAINPPVLTYRHSSGKTVSFFGDMHPSYAGNVVKAMASAKYGHPTINQELAKLSCSQKNTTEILKQKLKATVVAIHRLTPTIVEVVIHAPLAAQNFQPGQFYRLQNYERFAPSVNKTPFVMEGIAVTGAKVDKAQGLISTIVLEMGGSSNLCRYLQPGEPVVLMGPTGEPTEIPRDETVILIGGGLGNAVLFSIGQEMRSKGCKVLYFAGYKKNEDRYKENEIENAADQVIWCCDEPPVLSLLRPQDCLFHGNVVEAIQAYADNLIGHARIDIRNADRLIVIGSDRMMAAVAQARQKQLKDYFKPTLKGVASINSPMQCMMKEICAQCLQRHVDPITGVETIVYSCANQDQDFTKVDFNNLQQRLMQNSAQEKLTRLWVRHCEESNSTT